MSVGLRIEAVERHFQGFCALDAVSLDVAPGELLALLGPSGSGKTTLLRLIAGLDHADAGRVLFDGVDANSLTLRERRIGFVFQNYALFRHMRVFENIAFGLKARPSATRPPEGEIRRRVHALLELVQLAGLEARFPAQLSGGQRQRVALARALAIEPRVLLLDEPFGALDARVRQDLRAWLRDLHDKTGHTTVFVTHDQDEALGLADRIAILNKGRIEQVGTPDAVYDAPETGFVCGFLGETNSLPVSILNGAAQFSGFALRDAGTLPDGTKAELFVRPHEIALSEPRPGLLTGTILHIRRHGGIRRADIAISGLIKPLKAEIAPDIAFSPGDPVGLALGKAHVFVGQ